MPKDEKKTETQKNDGPFVDAIEIKEAGVKSKDKAAEKKN